MRALLKGILSAQAAEPPPVQCTTILTGDIAAGLPGAQPADISGLTFGKSDSVGLFLAGSPLPDGLRPMPAGDSIVWVQVGDFTASGGNARAGFAAFTAGGAVIGAISSRANLLLDQFDGTTGVDIGRYAITGSTPDPTMAIGIDADGWVYIRASGGLVRVDGLPVFEGAPTGRLVDGGGNPPAAIALLGTIDLTASIGSASGRFWVSQTEMDLTGLAGEDWCGTALPEIPACQIGYTLEVVEGSATVVGSRITVPASGSATRLTQSAPIYLSELTAPRIFEFTISTTGDAVAVGVLLRENTSSAYPRIGKPYNQSVVNFNSNPGPSAMGSVGQTYGICVTPEGTFSYFVDGVYGGELPAVASLDEFLFSVSVSNNFTGQPVIIDLRYTDFEYSAEYRAQVPTAGDWCGVALPEPPTELLFTLDEEFSLYNFHAENDGTDYDWVGGTAPQMPTPATIATAPLSPSAAELAAYLDAVEASITDGMADGTPMGWIGTEFGDDFRGAYNARMIFATYTPPEFEETLHDSLAAALAALVPGGFLAIWVRSMTVTDSDFGGWEPGDVCPGMAVSGPSETIVGFGMPEVYYDVSEA